MLIAHLSDPHLSTGPLAAGPAVGLFRALGRAIAIEPQPDWIVISGDLTEHGTAAEYEDLRQIIDGVAVPTYLMTGNHDNRDAFLAAFAGGPHLAGASEASYVVEHATATLVALDSLDPGHAGGRLGQTQLGWLDDQLQRRPQIPTLVAVHHPPIPVGIPFLDGIGLADGNALADVLARHPQVVRVLSGHVHRPITTAFGKTILTTAASTYRQTSLTLLADRRIGYLNEPPSFLVHQVSSTGCITHTVPVEGSAIFGY
jgi:3',5'-cyclic AMP phosphodiesterase CpdA